MKMIDAARFIACCAAAAFGLLSICICFVMVCLLPIMLMDM